MARHGQRTGGEHQGPFALSRKDVIHFNGLERMTAVKHLFELRTPRGKFKKHRVERAIAQQDSLVSAQHDTRISNRVEDRLDAFAFVDGLIDARAESSHIRERHHDAGYVAIPFTLLPYPTYHP